jgi:aryl-alcohol dehydrogenase-like predicted oxidoreductase
VGLIPWSPLARGVVARPWGEKSSKRAQSDAHKGFMFPANEVENNKIIVDRVEEIAKKNGKSMAATAVAWSWKKGMNPIIGMGSKERIDEAVGMMGTTLSDEDMVALDELYQPKNIAKAW